MKHTISLRNWDDIRGRAKGAAPEMLQLNNHLELIRSQITECYHDLVQNKRTITAEVIKRMYMGDGMPEHTLCNLMDYHNEHQKELLAEGTMVNYYTTKRYIHEFLKARRRISDIPLNDLNYQFINDFELFLRSQKPARGYRGLTNNGVMKHLERLRKVVSLGVRLEWIDRDPFKLYQLRFHKVERGFLTEDELEAIESRVFKKAHLQLVKDLFLFACYTGLSYADLMQLKPANIHEGMDGDKWIKITRQKSRTSVTTPLLPEALEIMERYEDDPRAVVRGSVFPSLSNQKLNSYLKEIAIQCKIEKNLTFHLARHTFATTVTLTNGVPIETVSKMLGHTKISTTQIYARVIEKKISEDMALLKIKRKARRINNG